MRQLYELSVWDDGAQDWKVIDLCGSLQKAITFAEKCELAHGCHRQPMTEREYIVIERVSH